MRKTVELSKHQIKAVEDFQKRNKLRSFTKAIQIIVDNHNQCDCKDEKPDEDFVLIADAIVKMDKKLDILIGAIAPKSAGEI